PLASLAHRHTHPGRSGHERSPAEKRQHRNERRGGTPTSSPLKAFLHSGSNESRHSLITNDFTNPSRMNGSSLEKASACSRVLKLAMSPRSVNGPMPSTTPRATYLSTTILWRGYTAMIASRLAPEDSPMTTAFMRFLRSGFLARFASSASAAAVPSRRRCDALGRVPLAKRVPMRLPDDASRCTRTPGMSRAVHGVGSMPLLCLKVSEIRSSPLPPEPA